MDSKKLGKNISDRRRELNMTSEQLAPLCDISWDHMRKIETGKKKPSMDTFLKICSSLEILPGKMLDDQIALPGPDGDDSERSGEIDVTDVAEKITMREAIGAYRFAAAVLKSKREESKQ